MTEHGFALFDTDIGPCGIAWGGRGVTGVQLPEASEARTRARLVRRYPHAREAPPAADVRRVIDGIVALLRGEASDLSAAALDMDGVAEFDRRVYEVARTSDAPTLFDGDRAFGFALKPSARSRR